MRALYYHGDDDVALEPSARSLSAARADPAGVLWLDMDGADPEASRALLCQVFHFHPLTIDDCLDAEQRPKVEDFGPYVFCVVRVPRRQDPSGDPREATEIDLYIGPNYVVTFHAGISPALQDLWQVASRDSRILAHGADHLAARCLAAFVDDMVAELDEMDEEIERVEVDLFAETGHESVQRLFRLRHDLSVMRRVMGPQRDVYNRLAWDGFAAVRPETRLYFREAYDRLVQALDLVDNRRDLTAVALETHLSVSSNRLNETVRLLAALQMVFLPLALVASVYGMNFADLPPFQSPAGWRLVLAAMLVIGLLQFVVFRRRGWL